jgi:hypothetical protein
MVMVPPPVVVIPTVPIPPPVPVTIESGAEPVCAIPIIAEPICGAAPKPDGRIVERGGVVKTVGGDRSIESVPIRCVPINDRPGTVESAAVNSREVVEPVPAPVVPLNGRATAEAGASKSRPAELRS